MRLGIERFFAEGGAAALRGRRVAVLVHHVSRTRAGVHLIEGLRAQGVEPALVLAPEHGLWGAAQDMEAVGSAPDPVLGGPVHSLYGADEGSLRLPDALLGSFDVLVADLQDVGSRYYTYAATLLMLMDQLAGRGAPVIVLDRPNPLGGQGIEGNRVDSDYRSFVSWFDVPIRHGLSVGELARWHAARARLDLPLVVEPVEGWRRDVPAPADTGLFYPSPNMPDRETAWLYPGLCLIEGTTLSEGRGTTRPFRLVGAPGVDAGAVARAFAGYEQPGVEAWPFAFRPVFGKHAGQTCTGLHLAVTDVATLRPWEAGLCLLAAFRDAAPHAWTWRTQAYEFVADRLAIDLLLGGPDLRQALEAGADPRDLARDHVSTADAFRHERAPHLLYPAA